MIFLTAFVSLLLCFGVIDAAVLQVPDDFELIQAAIEQAEPSDTVAVAPGEYHEIIDFSGHDIVIVGSPGNPAETIIDGNDNGPVVTFANEESNGAILNGFTIRNGRTEGAGGGGIFCSGANPSLRNLIIEDNYGNRGGGLLFNNSRAIMINTLITDNRAQAYGGGICFQGESEINLINVEISANEAVSSFGGGIANISQNRIGLANCRILENQAATDGGGIYTSGTTIFSNCSIADNISGRNGGGIYLGNDVQMTFVRITGNQAAGQGGGLYTICENANFYRLLAGHNTAQGSGGGLYISGDLRRGNNTLLTRSTIANNNAEDESGIYCFVNVSLTLNSSILWSDQEFQIMCDPERLPCLIEVSFTDLLNGENGIQANNNAEVSWLEGNIDEDPLFEDPEANSFVITWDHYPADDETKSPCIDVGDPELFPDPDGTRADLGYLHYHQLTPEIEVAPVLLFFEEVLAGESETLPFTISNIGEGRLSGTLEFDENGQAFSLDLENPNFDLAPEEELEVLVTFAPDEELQYFGEIQIHAIDPDEPLTIVRLIGNGLVPAPEIHTSTVHLDFETVYTDTSHLLPLEISNRGLIDLTGQVVLPEDQNVFQLVNEQPEFVIPPQNSVVFEIRFQPNQVRRFEENLQIESNDPDHPELEVTMVGVGADQPPVVVSQVADLELLEDSDWIMVCDLNEVFEDNQEELLRYSVSAFEFIQTEIREGQFFWLRPNPNYWVLDLECVISAQDLHLGVAADTLLIGISALNDLPQPFSLLSPPDRSQITDSSVTVRWQESRQNQWELDEFGYRITMTAADREIQLIQNNGTNYTVATGTILSRLGLSDQMPYQITWWVEAYDDSGSTESNQRRHFTITPNSIEPGQQIPDRFNLSAAYPNPFNSKVSFTVAIPHQQDLELRIFDAQGRLVSNLFRGLLTPGFHRFSWNAASVQQGIYLISFSYRDQTQIRKVLLLK